MYCIPMLFTLFNYGVNYEPDSTNVCVHTRKSGVKIKGVNNLEKILNLQCDDVR